MIGLPVDKTMSSGHLTIVLMGAQIWAANPGAVYSRRSRCVRCNRMRPWPRRRRAWCGGRVADGFCSRPGAPCAWQARPLNAPKGERPMTEPSGKIVARPLVARACGHEQEFQHYEVDKYRPQRLAKFQATRCAACVAQLHEEQRRAAVPKEEALKRLPPGAQVTLIMQPDGS